MFLFFSRDDQFTLLLSNCVKVADYTNTSDCVVPTVYLGSREEHRSDYTLHDG